MSASDALQTTLPAPAPIRLQCAWCPQVIRDGDPSYISHGICASCFEREMAAVQSLQKVYAKGAN